MYCSILTNIHLMLGRDIHLGTIGPPDPPKPMPHYVAQVLGGLNLSAKLVPSVSSHNFIVLNQGSDIGMGIGHVAPNILFPIYVLTSSSTSNFGSFTVLSGDKPTAVALGVYVNMNLNCGQPVNTPTGMVIAPGCNMIGMTFGEILAGLVSIAVNMAISFALDRLGKVNFGKKFNKKWGLEIMQGKMADYAIQGVAKIAGRMSVSAGLMFACVGTTKFVKDVVFEVMGSAIAQFTGVGQKATQEAIMDSYNKALLPTYESGENLNE